MSFAFVFKICTFRLFIYDWPNCLIILRIFENTYRLKKILTHFFCPNTLNNDINFECR